MREIVFDTETTGLEAFKEDRLVEIGCVEIVNRFLTGKQFHVYINPQRSMPQEAFNVHGLSETFLADKPVFSAIVDDFMAFVGDAPLIAHNANFDMGFVNAELKRLGRPALPKDRFVDTLLIARRRHPGQSNTLDALCARYGIDTSRRIKHGALLDAEILAEVYIELTGGKQSSLELASSSQKTNSIGGVTEKIDRLPPLTYISRVSEQEMEKHRLFIAEMGDKALWNQYIFNKDPE